MRVLWVFALFLAVASRGYSAEPDDQFKTLYRARQWFTLRDAVAGVGAPAFYRGAVAWAFNDPRKAEELLRQAIAAAPGSWEAIEAHRLLTTWYSLTGQYRRAFREYKVVHELMPNSDSVKREVQALKVWSRYPQPAVRSRHESSVRYDLKDGDIFLPIVVNGSEAHYLIDTGSNICLISEREAKRVGMILDPAPGLQIHDSSGTSGGFRIAVAKELVLGGFRLRNVMFLVLPDDRLPFANLPVGWRGILGLPVLFAWQTVRWNRDGTFEVGFRSGAYSQRTANLCFSGEGPHPVVRGEFAKKPVEMVLDTGAMKSRLLPFFAESFAEVVHGHGQKEVTQLRGTIGSKEIETLVLPEASLRIGDFDTVLRPAELVKNYGPFGNSQYHIWLGSDLLQQARQVTIDFGSMRVVLE